MTDRSDFFEVQEFIFHWRPTAQQEVEKFTIHVYQPSIFGLATAVVNLLPLVA
jgi:hypothetical protein